MACDSSGKCEDQMTSGKGSIGFMQKTPKSWTLSHAVRSSINRPTMYRAENDDVSFIALG